MKQVAPLGSRSSLQKNNFYGQNWRWSKIGEHPKNSWDPPIISAAAKTSNFKFGTQLGFREYVAKTTLRPNLAGVGQGSIPKVLGAPTYFCNCRI